MASRSFNLTSEDIQAIIDAMEAYPTAEKDCLQPRMRRVIAKITRPVKKIKPSSAKAKGRKLQQWTMLKIAQLLKYKIPAEMDLSAIKSREMGQAGVDVVIKSAKMRKAFPFAIECKNQEQVSLPAWLRQAQANITDTMPHFMLIIHNKLISKPVIVIDWAGLEAIWNRRPYNKGQGEAKN